MALAIAQIKSNEVCHLLALFMALQKDLLSGIANKKTPEMVKIEYYILKTNTS